MGNARRWKVGAISGKTGQHDLRETMVLREQDIPSGRSWMLESEGSASRASKK